MAKKRKNKKRRKKRIYLFSPYIQHREPRGSLFGSYWFKPNGLVYKNISGEWQCMGVRWRTEANTKLSKITATVLVLISTATTTAVLFAVDWAMRNL